MSTSSYVLVLLCALMSYATAIANQVLHGTINSEDAQNIVLSPHFEIPETGSISWAIHVPVDPECMHVQNVSVSLIGLQHSSRTKGLQISLSHGSRRGQILSGQAPLTYGTAHQGNTFQNTKIINSNQLKDANFPRTQHVPATAQNSIWTFNEYTSNGENLAFGASVDGTTAMYHTSPSSITDGSRNPFLTGGSVYHSIPKDPTLLSGMVQDREGLPSSPVEPWLELDLGSATSLDTLALFFPSTDPEATKPAAALEFTAETASQAHSVAEAGRYDGSTTLKLHRTFAVPLNAFTRLTANGPTAMPLPFDPETDMDLLPTEEEVIAYLRTEYGSQEVGGSVPSSNSEGYVFTFVFDDSVQTTEPILLQDLPLYPVSVSQTSADTRTQGSRHVPTPHPQHRPKPPFGPGAGSGSGSSHVDPHEEYELSVLRRLASAFQALPFVSHARTRVHSTATVSAHSKTKLVYGISRRSTGCDHCEFEFCPLPQVPPTSSTLKGPGAGTLDLDISGTTPAPPLFPFLDATCSETQTDILLVRKEWILEFNHMPGLPLPSIRPYSPSKSLEQEEDTGVFTRVRYVNRGKKHLSWSSTGHPMFLRPFYNDPQKDTITTTSSKEPEIGVFLSSSPLGEIPFHQAVAHPDVMYYHPLHLDTTVFASASENPPHVLLRLPHQVSTRYIRIQRSDGRPLVLAELEAYSSLAFASPPGPPATRTEPLPLPPHTLHDKRAGASSTSGTVLAKEAGGTMSPVQVPMGTYAPMESLNAAFQGTLAAGVWAVHIRKRPFEGEDEEDDDLEDAAEESVAQKRENLLSRLGISAATLARSLHSARTQVKQTGSSPMLAQSTQFNTPSSTTPTDKPPATSFAEPVSSLSSWKLHLTCGPSPLPPYTPGDENTPSTPYIPGVSTPGPDEPSARNTVEQELVPPGWAFPPVTREWEAGVQVRVHTAPFYGTLHAHLVQDLPHHQYSTPLPDEDDPVTPPPAPGSQFGLNKHAMQHGLHSLENDVTLAQRFRFHGTPAYPFLSLAGRHDAQYPFSHFNAPGIPVFPFLSFVPHVAPPTSAGNNAPTLSMDTTLSSESTNSRRLHADYPVHLHTEPLTYGGKEYFPVAQVSGVKPTGVQCPKHRVFPTTLTRDSGSGAGTGGEGIIPGILDPDLERGWDTCIGTNKKTLKHVDSVTNAWNNDPVQHALELFPHLAPFAGQKAYSVDQGILDTYLALDWIHNRFTVEYALRVGSGDPPEDWKPLSAKEYIVYSVHPINSQILNEKEEVVSQMHPLHVLELSLDPLKDQSATPQDSVDTARTSPVFAALPDPPTFE